MTRAVARIAAIALLPALLSGCVAALIPLAAGGLIAGKDDIGLRNGAKATPGENVRPSASLPATPQLTLLETDTLPAPGPAARSSPMPRSTVFAELSAYVDTEARRDPVMEPRLSALLAAPGSLSPERSDCSIRPPAIVLDLDPAGAVFDPSVEAASDPALVQALQAVRMQDVVVFWASALPLPEAGAVRKRLIASGLDPVGRDGLLLLRRADDRKQSRRRDLGETHCVVAILGDTKADFDELYDYLSDPAAAFALDQLIGAGWFLTPPPLITTNHTEGP